MRQGRPADPTDPGDAADLSIMGYLSTGPEFPRPVPSALLEKTFAQEQLKINHFLTRPRESLNLR